MTQATTSEWFASRNGGRSHKSCKLYFVNKEYLFPPVLSTIFLIRWALLVALGLEQWWRHQMGTFSALLAVGAGNSPVTDEFRSQMNSPLKGQWRGALMFSLICDWMDSWVNNGEAGDFRCHWAHYELIVIHRKRCNKWLKCDVNIRLLGPAGGMCVCMYVGRCGRGY